MNDELSVCLVLLEVGLIQVLVREYWSINYAPFTVQCSKTNTKGGSTYSTRTVPLFRQTTTSILRCNISY